jgi:hypothetical protein
MRNETGGKKVMCPKANNYFLTLPRHDTRQFGWICGGVGMGLRNGNKTIMDERTLHEDEK